MAWKKKERELTKEEAVRIAKKDLAPYWFNGPPWIAAAQAEGSDQIKVFPLDDELLKRKWLMVFLDLTQPSAPQVLNFVSEYQSRYAGYGFMVICVIEGSYPFIRDRDSAVDLMERMKHKVLSVVDFDGSFSKRFKEWDKEGFRWLLFNGLQLINSGTDDVAQRQKFYEIEHGIQHLLRESDKGLPLPPIFLGPQLLARELSIHNFRSTSKLPGWIKVVGGPKQESECIVVSSKDIKLVLDLSGPGLAITARALTKLALPLRVQIEVNGGPIYESAAGSDMIIDESGRSCIEVKEARTYLAVGPLRPKDRRITLSFPEIEKVGPVALFGLRVYEEVED